MIAIFAATAIASAAAPRPDFTLSADRIAAVCRAESDTFRARAQRIAANSHPTFAGVTLALENASADFSDHLAAALNLFNVAPERSVRDASLACSSVVSAAFADVESDPRLYRALLSASGKGERSVYDRKLQEYWIATMRNSGAALPTGSRTEFVRLQNELTELQNRFAQNLNEASPSIAVSAAAVRGIPADIVASYTRGRDGSYAVPVNESTASFLQYSPDPQARRAFFLALNNRAGAKNVAIFERAIAVRDRMAHLLGYQSWADTQLQGDRMARSVPRVEKFLETTSSALRAPSDADLDAAREAVAADEHRTIARLDAWDVQRGFFLVRKAHDLDSDAVRAYFSVEHTIAAVLDVYHTLLGVDFVPAHPNALWSSEVLAYDVRDSASKALLGTTYFDLYPRPGKYGHFMNVSVLPARVISGVRRPALALIVGNWPKPAPNQSALLAHDDVVTFFHEFGHDLAALLATAPYETLSNGFRTDFVEAPSQMLENFAWQPAILKKITANVRTGEPMPDAMIASLVANRRIGKAYDMERLVAYSIADLRFHSSGAQVASTAMWRAAMHDYFPVLDLPQVTTQVSFNHLMSGYDAGLYAYPWARVYAQDLFSAFASAGVENPAVGMRYRKTILEPARTYEPDAEVGSCLGRPMSPAAFYAEYGATAPL